MDFQASTKPWEAGGSSYYTSQSSSSPFHTDRLHSAPVPFPGGPGGGGGGGSFLNSYPMVAPPVPPRPNQTRPIYTASSNYYNRNMTPTYSNNYSSPYYYNASPYSSFNSRYSNFNRLPSYGPLNNGDQQPSIAELAEESSASAFHSIESFVNAFGSISSMLESTFHAVYSSFRAVVEVADHLGRVKQVFHTLAIFRFLRWVYKRILYLIGISKIKPEQIESVWNSVITAESGNGADWAKPKNKSTWPIIVFLGFIFSGPYLIWKLIGSLNLNKKAPNWATGEGDHFIAIPDFDFEPANDGELRLRKGNRIRLAPATHQPEHIKGWVLASDGAKIGLVPVNYIKVMGKGNGSVPQQAPIARFESPSVIPHSAPPPHFPTISTSESPSISRSSSQSTLKWTDTALTNATEEV